MVGKKIGHQESAALRFLDSFSLLGKEFFDVGAFKVRGKLFPERGVRRFNQLDNFPRGNSLR